MSIKNKYHLLTTFSYYEFEQPKENCIICESKRLVYWDSVRSMAIVRCKDCGVKFVNPFPSDKCLESLYAGGLLRWSNINEYEQSRKDYFTFYLNQLQRLNPQGEKLLDIGCGIGTFMEMATTRGIKPVGVDISRSDLEIARSRGLSVVDINEINKLAASSFDFCTMLDFLEHIKDPKYYLKIANRSLRKNGLLLIDTGDTGGLSGMVGKARNPFVQNEGHLVFYDRKSIDWLLTKNGFKIIEILDQSVVKDIPLKDKLLLLLISRPNMFVFARKFD